MQTAPREVWLNITAVVMALVVVHILGRFIFTPLMPYFIQEGVFNLSQATDLASVNYLGYLIGALLAVVSATPKLFKKMLLIMLMLNIITTIGQCFSADFWVVLMLRLVNGISNGAVFVLAPALMLEWLHARNKAHLSGLVYFGVSAGLVLSGFLVSATAAQFSGVGRWIPVAALSVMLGAFAMYRLATIQVSLPVTKNAHGDTPLFDKSSTLLFLAYLGAGFGYILPMTFLPTLAYQLDANEPLNAHIWMAVATACVLTTSFWNKLGATIGDRRAILASYGVQALGVLALLISPNSWGLFVCAVGVGGGFLGSVMCTQRYARALQPTQGVKLSAVLITIYAGAQLLAPILAKWWIGMGASLLMTFALGLVAFVWSLVMMLLIQE